MLWSITPIYAQGKHAILSMNDDTTDAISNVEMTDTFFSTTTAKQSDMSSPEHNASLRPRWWRTSLRIVGVMIILGFAGFLVVIYRGAKPLGTEIVAEKPLSSISQSVPEDDLAPVDQQDRFLEILKQRLNDNDRNLSDSEDKGTSEISDTPAPEDESSELFTDNQNDATSEEQEPRQSALSDRDLDEGVKPEVSLDKVSLDQKGTRDVIKDDVTDLDRLIAVVNRVKDKNFFTVQLAAYGHEHQALSRWDDLRDTYPQWLDGLVPEVHSGPEGSGLYRLRVGRFQTRVLAEALCAQLQDQGESCFVLQTSPR